MKTLITALLIAVGFSTAAYAEPLFGLDGKGNDPLVAAPAPGDRVARDFLPQDMDPY